MSEKMSWHNKKEGDVVYLVDQAARGDSELIVKKGTVDVLPKDPLLTIALWETIDSGPGINQAYLSEGNIFTAEEATNLIELGGVSNLILREIDEIVSDPLLNKELVIILGGAAIHRLAQEELSQQPRRTR